MADSMLVEYIIPKPMTDRSSKANITTSIAIPRFRPGFEVILMILPFKQRMARSSLRYLQLMGLPVEACEQLFSFTVDTRVVTGRWRVLGSIFAARRVSTACTVSTVAMVLRLEVLTVTGSPTTAVSAKAVKMLVF